MRHACKDKDKNSIIYKWKKGDGYEELVGKWTLDSFGFNGERTMIEIKFCPYCGRKLK